MGGLDKLAAALKVFKDWLSTDVVIGDAQIPA